MTDLFLEKHRALMVDVNKEWEELKALFLNRVAIYNAIDEKRTYGINLKVYDEVDKMFH